MARFGWRRGAALCAAATLIPLWVVAVATPANADTGGCATHVASDFNGDGFADVAAGAAGRTVGGAEAAGSVRVFYGGPTGVGVSGTDQYFDQNSSGIFGAPTKNDNFGFAVASGYFNGDCYADLAIGTPGENDITILYGSVDGLTTAGTVHMSSNQSGSGFGYSLTVGDFNGDGIDDLAADAVDATDAGATNSGEVGVMYGNASGLQQPSTWINQSTSSVPGVAEKNDFFGLALAAGDFTGDGVSDLAIGTPYEDNGSITDGGSVTIALGSTSHGLTGTGAQLFTQSTSGVPGTDEKGDGFGGTLAAGDVNGDGKADLAIGTQLENVGSVTDAGSVTYLAGTSTGLTASGAKLFTQGVDGVPGTSEKGDQFGTSLAIGDFNGDGKGDIAVGTPSEDIGSLVDAGSVTIIPGTSAGPTGTGSTSWSQNTTGVGGTSETGDLFGDAVAAVRISSTAHDDLVVGVPCEATGGPACTGALNILPGSATGPTATGSQYVAEPTDKAGQGVDDLMGWSVG